jgi:ribonuclease inhibitor
MEGVTVEVHLDGSQIRTERDFHQQMAQQLDLGQYYGHNLHALWDRLSTDVERPCTIVWHDAEVSRANLGPIFSHIISVFDRTVQRDRESGWEDRFEYVLA